MPPYEYRIFTSDGCKLPLIVYGDNHVIDPGAATIELHGLSACAHATVTERILAQQGPYVIIDGTTYHVTRVWPAPVIAPSPLTPERNTMTNREYYNGVSAPRILAAYELAQAAITARGCCREHITTWLYRTFDPLSAIRTLAARAAAEDDPVIDAARIRRALAPDILEPLTPKTRLGYYNTAAEAFDAFIKAHGSLPPSPPDVVLAWLQEPPTPVRPLQNKDYFTWTLDLCPVSFPVSPYMIACYSRASMLGLVTFDQDWASDRLIMWLFQDAERIDEIFTKGMTRGSVRTGLSTFNDRFAAKAAWHDVRRLLPMETGIRDIENVAAWLMEAV